MEITRRAFLQFLAVVAASSGRAAPAFSSSRAPYVCKGEVVNYIGPGGNGFIGGQLVKSVGAWDGIGFPVVTLNNGYRGECETYYDIDLADFGREIPEKFWHTHSRREYPNVHTWLRMKRYGETLSEASRLLDGRAHDEYPEQPQ